MSRPLLREHVYHDMSGESEDDGISRPLLHHSVYRDLNGDIVSNRPWPKLRKYKSKSFHQPTKPMDEKQRIRNWEEHIKANSKGEGSLIYKDFAEWLLPPLRPRKKGETFPEKKGKTWQDELDQEKAWNDWFERTTEEFEKVWQDKLDLEKAWQDKVLMDKKEKLELEKLEREKLERQKLELDKLWEYFVEMDTDQTREEELIADDGNPNYERQM